MDEQRWIKNKKLEHWQIIAIYLATYDAIVSIGAYFFALWVRFDCSFSMIPEIYLSSWLKFSPWYVIITLIIYWRTNLYNSVWRFASFVELKRMTIASVLSTIVHVVLITLFIKRMPISYYVIGSLVQFFLSLAIRFSYRFVLLVRSKSRFNEPKILSSRVMLIGAGAAGQMILRDLNTTDKINDHIVCIIDDNPNKWGRYIDDVPIVGGREDILYNVKKYKIEKIYLAMPSATAKQRRDILDICKETNCELKTLPGVYQFTNGVRADAMKSVNVEDLLGREVIKVNMSEIFETLSGKVILVTGGGGSIGSELCRQIAANAPKQLIIFDIYENNAYSIQMELKDLYPNLNLVVLIGSVRDSERLNEVFSTYHPDIVYHAAAHKHVPLMEDSPCEAIKNNVIGTYKTAYAAMQSDCKRFVLISTDKAVNPTNVMGASKRICEMIIQSFDKKIREGRTCDLHALQFHEHDEDIDSSFSSKAEFVAVRFGNVLGSNGSVIPRFKEQIAKGGPVTVTHPDIIRYFMTIPEAASLVLQAGTYAKGGEIFVLDMGEPVKIDTLARNLIRLSGLTPDVDIKISYTGLRPGEKLYEEKLMAEEGLATTPNHLIHIGKPIEFDADSFLMKLKPLLIKAYANECETIREDISMIVPTYKYEKDR